MINRNLIKISIILSLVMSMLLPMTVLADNTASASAPFTVHKDDYLLGVVLKGFLGDVVNSSATGADEVISNAGNLGEIFRTFNFGVAFFGTLMVTFITVVGVLQSGNDGEFLGRRWSSMWVPVRFATGSALMLPLTTSGYSLVQAMVLWIVVQGVSFTDTLWDTAVDKLMVRTTAQVWGAIDGAAIAKTVAYSEVCLAAVTQETAAAAAAGAGLPGLNPTVYALPGKPEKSESNSRITRYRYGLNWGVKPVGELSDQWANSNDNDRRICGQMMLEITKNEDDIYRDVRESIAKQHVRSVEKISLQVRKEAQDYVAAFNNTNMANPDVLRDAHYKLMAKIALLGEQYRKEVAEFAGAEVEEASKDASSAVGDGAASPDNMKKYGFVTAGMFYIDMTRVHGAIRQAVTDVPTYTYPDIGSQWAQDANLKQILAAYQSASDSAAAAANRVAEVITSGGANISTPPKFDASILEKAEEAPDPQSAVNSISKGLAAGTINAMFGVGSSNTGASGGVWQWGWDDEVSNNTSAIMQLKNKGDNILDITGVLLTSYVAATAVAEGAEKGLSSSWVPGSSLLAAGSGAIAGIFRALMPMIYALVFALIGFGITLSIYLPMLPYMLWMGGVTGYLILIAEALVASSLWAVMLMHPSGEGMTGQHSERGVMLLLGLFTRPALMLMGMLTGMFMVEPLVTMINDTFYYAMLSVQGATVSMLFAAFGFCAIYISLLITAINKCFALIHLMPDKVLRWVGGGGEQLGETEIEGQARNNVVAVAGGFSTAGQAGGRAKQERAREKGNKPPDGNAEKKEGKL